MDKIKKFITKIKPQLFLSIDVETDGPTPIINNLLSIGIVGMTLCGDIIYKFEANIKPLETHSQDKKTMETFWLKPKQENAWNYLTINQRNFIEVFEQLSNELEELNRKYNLVFAAKPACFDWMFYKCYYEYAKSKSIYKDKFYDIGFKCICISTLTDYYKNLDPSNISTINNLMDEIKKNVNDMNIGVEHNALFDAMIQGLFYCNLLKKLNEFY